MSDRRWGSQIMRPSMVPDPRVGRKAALAARVLAFANECHTPAGSSSGGQFCERVSSAKPSSKGGLANYRAGEGPRMSLALIGDKALPEVIRRQSGVPGFEDLVGRKDRAALSEIVDRQAENIVDAVDRHLELNKEVALAHSEWYPTASEWAGDVADRLGYPKNSVVAAVAVLSPGADWSNNIAWSLHIAEQVKNDPVVPEVWAQAHYFTRLGAYETKLADHQAKLDSGETTKPYSGQEPEYRSDIVGKKLSELSDIDAAIAIRGGHDSYGGGKDAVHQLGGRPGFGKPSLKAIPQTDENLSKAVSVLRDNSTKNLDAKLGNEAKVRSFFNNISRPRDTEFEDATIDTHAYGSANSMPYTMNSPAIASGAKSITGGAASGDTGVSGTYPLVVEAHRKAAAIINKKYGLDLKPNQIQSIAWEQHRQDWPRKSRTTQIQEAIGSIHTRRAQGEISKAEEKRLITEARAGFKSVPTDAEIKQNYLAELKL